MAHILQLFLLITGACFMDDLPNLKIEKICLKLANIDSEIIQSSKKQDDVNIRRLVDQRRHLLALLRRESIATSNQQDTSLALRYVPRPEVKHFIYSWCNKLKTLSLKNISYKSSSFCDLLFDYTLPEAWNFEDDLMIIHQPPSANILEVAQRRNQEHMIICDLAHTVPCDVIEFAKLNGIQICTSLANLERTVSLLQISAQQVISVTCENNPTTELEMKTAIADAVNAGKRTRKENTATVSKFGRSWSTNVLKNIKNFQNSKNLHQLEVDGVQDAIIVASGPSLTKNVAKLRAIQDSIFIVSALRSLPILNAAGIDADLVIQLDAEDEKVAKGFSPDTLRPVKNLLIEGMVNEGFFAIPAQNTIWSLPQHFFDIHQKFSTRATPFNVPSVSIYALSLCHFLNFKNICFIGQDLAASSEKQYADGATNLLPAHANISMFQIEVPGFFGGTVLTRNSYQYQIKRCSELAAEWKAQQHDLNLVNATEGGAFISGFDHMTLDAFIEKRKLKTMQTTKSVSFSQNFPITTDIANSYLQAIHKTMTNISILADMIIKLDGQPEKTVGLEKKMKKLIQKFQTQNNSTSLLNIAMQENIATVIGTSRKIETVDTYTQFFEKVKKTALLLKDAAKY